jgi:hypothetical protein
LVESLVVSAALLAAVAGDIGGYLDLSTGTATMTISMAPAMRGSLECHGIVAYH